VTASTAIAQPAPVCPVFQALGDPNRLRIISRLCDGGPSSTTQVTDAVSVSRQAVTKHLLTLQSAGLVGSQRHGRERIWEVRTKPLGQASDYLTQLSRRWDGVIERLRAFVEGPDDRQP
jgi:DNA-binding transcriptional ArsR family regulator